MIENYLFAHTLAKSPLIETIKSIGLFGNNYIVSSVENSGISFKELLATYQYEIIVNLFLLCLIILFLFRKNHKKLMNQLNYDSLTGLLTEKKFMEEASKVVRFSTKTYCLVSLDIDNFKYLNETFGYEKGTELIKLTAKHVMKHYKKGTLMCRVYGDQFLILTDKPVKSNPICGRETCIGCINQSLSEGLSSSVIINTSVGIYPVRDRNEPLSYMIDCANLARRLGKETYGHTRVVFDWKMKNELNSKNKTVAAMENAINNNEFYLAFQPQYDLETEKIIGSEALVRWNYQGEHIKPDHFIPLFEKNGFIKKLDFFVLEEVCKVIKSLEKPIPIAVNFSGATILEESFFEKIVAVVQKYEIAPHYLEVEITEGVFSKNFKQMSDLVFQLRELGFSVAMDDFGSGVSSLNRLKNLKFDVLKIDKEFLGDSLDTIQGDAIIKAIVTMSKALDLKVVAEGVETKRQSECLHKLGCDIAQGYYYARPLPIQDFIHLCERNAT